MKKISAVIIACSMGLAVQAQVIDPLTGSLAGYTTTLVNDGGSGGASSVSFSDSASGLQANFAGTVNDPEQALFLAPASSFSTTFAVGDTLWVNVAMPVSSTAMDFGLPFLQRPTLLQRVQTPAHAPTSTGPALA